MTNPADDILQRIQAENERRLAVGHSLATAIGARIEAERALSEARASEKQALTEAKKAGWTDAELNRIAGKPSPKRRQSRTATNSTDYVPTQGTTDSEGSDD